MFLCYHHDNGGSGGSSDCNMKKALTILLVLAVIAVMPLAAADRRGTSEEGAFGIGLNLGTNNGVGLKFGMGNFDIIANIGLDVLHVSNQGLGLGGDVGFQYEVYDIQIDGPHHMPVTVGLLVPMGFFFGSPFQMSLGVQAMAGLEYQIPDVPVLFYLRVGLGIDMNVVGGGNFKVGFGGSGALGVMYTF